jgi:membrane-associated protease RseP (regulator of RpoE activity)
VTRKALVQPRAWAFGPASLAQPGASVAAGRLFVAIAAIVVRVRRGTGGSRAQGAVADSGWLTQWLWLAGGAAAAGAALPCTEMLGDRAFVFCADQHDRLMVRSDRDLGMGYIAQ